MARAISIDKPGFIRKSRSIFLACRTGPGKPRKSWNFIMAFSRTGKSWKRATGPGKFWKLLLKTQLKNITCMERSKENWHWDLGRVGVNVNFRALKKQSESWKSPGNLFVKKCTNHVLRYSHWSLTGQFGIMESTHNFFSFLLCQSDVK